MDIFRYNRIYSAGLSALILVLPFSMALPNIFLALVIVLFLVKARRFPFKVIMHTPSLLYLIFLMYLSIKAIWTGNFVDDFFFYDLLFIVLVIPLLIMNEGNRRMLKKVLLVSMIASIVVSLYYALRFYLHFGYFPYTEGWMVNSALVLERPYAGFVSIISILVSLDLARNAVRSRWIYYLSAIVSLIFIFFISARLSIGTIVLLAVLYLAVYLKISRAKKIAVTLGLVGLVVLTLLKSNSLSLRFFIKDDIATSLNTAAELEPRAVIWPCVWEITANEDFNWITGFESFSEIPGYFKECYKKIGNKYMRDYFLSKVFNSHNQFMEFLLIGGVAGVLLFCFFLTAMGWSARRDFFALSILLSSVLFFTFENVLYRQFGAYIFSIIAAIYIWPSVTDEKN